MLLRRRGAIFLSTPSARRATVIRIKPRFSIVYFYPRPPRGGRLQQEVRRRNEPLDFYPRPPRGGRRLQGVPTATDWEISIHALREEGDSLGGDVILNQRNFYPRPPRGGRLRLTPRPPRCALYFYPRPPRGGRLTDVLELKTAQLFLSTPSARRATMRTGLRVTDVLISIHALREEGDSCQ